MKFFCYVLGQKTKFVFLCTLLERQYFVSWKSFFTSGGKHVEVSVSNTYILDGTELDYLRG